MLMFSSLFDVAVHGNWSEWGEFGECSVSCGKGTQTRFRACDNPPAAYGGRDCIGESEDIRPCNDFPCAGNSLVMPTAK